MREFIFLRVVLKPDSARQVDLESGAGTELKKK
jgi:hypothetical protein